MPAYNEARTIDGLLQRVLLQPSVGQVVVIDDGSTDDTLLIAQATSNDPRLTIKRQPANLGKGAAIRVALETIMTPIVMIQDADMQYDPVDYAVGSTVTARGSLPATGPGRCRPTRAVSR